MWYVVQVRTGTEKSVQKQYETVIGKEAEEQCVIPYYEEMRRMKGEWSREVRTLFPGYVFLISRADVAELAERLKKVIGLTKLIGTGTTVVPLTEDEIAFMLRFVGSSHIVSMSKGVIENDRVRVTEGPLIGQEGYIRRIDRHKRKAWLEIRMFGRIQKIEVGLEILQKTKSEVP